ncbi:MAG: hypothetical protein NVSMB19_05150 [Vulcanimicrobiaceae bacterium]
MKLGLRVVAASAALLVTSAGCSNGGGIFGLDLPDGNIVVANTLTGQPLVTSEAAPFVVTDLRFSISISEGRFNGPYTVSIVKQQNVATPANNNAPYPFAFNLPCFVPHQTDTTSHANVVTFLGDNGNGKPASFSNNPFLTPAERAAGGNPCHSGELETAQIGDGKGHSVLFYYQEQ